MVKDLSFLTLNIQKFRYFCNMKKIRVLLLTIISFFLMIIVGNTGCEGDYPIEPIAYDSAYQVRFYDKPPFVDFAQGYWSQNKFVNLIPNAAPPFYFLIRARNDGGKKTIHYLAEKENSIIQQLTELSNGDFLITATQYFESSSIYISDNYYSEGDAQRRRILIRPTVTIKMKAGRDIKTVEEQFPNTLYFDHDNGETVSDPSQTQYTYTCRYNNSYQVLTLVSEIHQHEDVDWAKADLYSP